jgi:hypothetical protein
MSGVRGRVMPVLAAAVVLVGGANLAAYAVNGHPLLLGGDNHAVGTTTVDNDGHGPALMLKTRKDAPPMAVTSHRMVRHLNADLVDGLPGGALRTRSWTYRIGGDSDEGPTVVKTFPGLPPGQYLASYNMVAWLYADGYPMSCWFDTASQTKAVYGRALQDVKGALVVAASGYVDATGPIAMTCQASPAFDTMSSAEGQPDSQVTFIRLDTSSVQWNGGPPRNR